MHKSYVYNFVASEIKKIMEIFSSQNRKVARLPYYVPWWVALMGQCGAFDCIRF
jgi:hypothetical protein